MRSATLPAAMDPFFHLVEQKLADAVRAGQFDQLRGFGQPLVLEDLSGMPDELRASYLLLRGAGFVPPELAERKEWLRLEDLLAACTDDGERVRLRREAQQAQLRYRLLLEQRGVSQGLLDYHDPLLQRLAAKTANAAGGDATERTRGAS
jgi:hypothetical protein